MGKRVKWTELRRVDYDGMDDWIKAEHQGEIIDAVSSATDRFLVVACDDNKVREVHISNVTIIPDRV